MQDNTPETTETSPLDSLSFEQYEHWRDTGEMPKTEAADGQQTTEAESTGSDSGEQDVEPAEAESAEVKKESSEDSEQEEKRGKRGGFQRKIDRLSRENEELNRRIAELNSKLAPPSAEAGASEPKGEPKEGDYADYGQYVKALTEYQIEQKRTADLNTERERLQREAHGKVVEAWKERIADARTRYSDFNEVISAPDVPITTAMQEVLLTSEAGADLAYWLGKNPAEAQRIARLSPLATARELGRVEASLAKPATPAPKRTTSAPPPPSTVRGARTPATHSVYDDALASDYNAWEKARNEQIRNR